MEILIYKLPLIVIVAPQSGIVNRQCGLGNSKYVVILDPLPTGHVKRRMRSELLVFNMGRYKFEALYLRNGAR